MPGQKPLTGKVANTALKMLESTTAILEENNVEYILDFGTLLGIIREDRLLPWDTDLDISITDDQVDKLLKLKWKLWRAGYRLRVYCFKRDTGPYKKGDIRIIKIQERLLLFFAKHSLMDVFVKKEYKDALSYVVGANKSYLKTTPKEFHEKRAQITFRGKKYTVPKDYNAYLRYVYGDWKTPVKEGWDFRSSDNCTQDIYHFKKENIFKKVFQRVIFW
jgi:lipopolysaccharide cholinephosphotransferase